MNYQSLYIQIEMILFSAISSSVEQKTKKTACAFCNYKGKLVGCHQTVRRLQNSRFFFLEISKEIGKAWRKSLGRAKHARREKKRLLASLPTLALCFQPRSRPFV